MESLASQAKPAAVLWLAGFLQAARLHRVVSFCARFRPLPSLLSPPPPLLPHLEFSILGASRWGDFVVVVGEFFLLLSIRCSVANAFVVCGCSSRPLSARIAQCFLLNGFIFLGRYSLLVIEVEISAKFVLVFFFEIYYERGRPKFNLRE